MKLKTFIKSFYLFQFCFDLIFIYAVEKLFLLSRGITLSQIGILLFCWSIMTLLLEVPSGALADKWSRKKVLVLSGLFFSLCYLIWIFSHSFYLFLLGFVFRTLGGVFASGTLQAYVYDFLKNKQAEKKFAKIWGRGNALRTLGIGVAVAFGGFLSEISYELTVFLSAASVFLVAMIAFFWPDIKAYESTEETKYWQLVKKSFGLVLKNKNLLILMLYTAIVLAVPASIEEFNDVYLSFLGYPRFLIGLIFTIACIFQSLASNFAYKFKKYSWQIINLSVIFIFLVLILAGLIKSPVMMIPILSLGVLLEFISVLKEGLIQKETASYQRATVSSINGLIMNLVPHALVFALIANYFNLQIGYIVLGLPVLSYFIFSFLIKKNYEQK